MRKNKALSMATALLLALALLALSVIAISCGGKTAAPGSTGLESVSTGNTTIDNSIRRLDSQMNSLSPDDFGEDRLSNSSLNL